jgi:hypothetical protein
VTWCWEIYPAKSPNGPGKKSRLFEGPETFWPPLNGMSNSKGQARKAFEKSSLMTPWCRWTWRTRRTHWTSSQQCRRLSASFWRKIPKCMPWLALSLCGTGTRILLSKFLITNFLTHKVPNPDFPNHKIPKLQNS